MINWFDVPSESPNKDLTLKNLKVSENGTYGESGVAYSSVEVNVNSGGGGGSSDFSTAEVTIINNLPASISFTLYGAIDDFSGDFELSPNTLPSCIGVKNAEQSENTTKVYSAALYEEHGILSINSSYHISIAGNIEKLITGEEYYIYDVTGDCTITIEATPEP